MKVKASLKNLQISPRKVRLIADLIRGVSISDARQALKFSTKKAALPVLKLINSAVANAENNHKLDPSSLKIASIIVNHGRTLKRYKPRAFGRATMIRKRASHIEVVLDGDDSKATAAPAPKKPGRKDGKIVSETDQEQAKPEEKGKQTGEKFPQTPHPVDPRRLGHERPTQHVDKKKQGPVKV